MSTKRDHWLKKNAKIEPKPQRMSVMQALETAVLILEQHGHTEEQIMQFVHLIHLGLIRNGELTPEYLELAAQAQRDREALETIPEEDLPQADAQWHRDRRKREIDEAIGTAVTGAQQEVRIIRTDVR